LPVGDLDLFRRCTGLDAPPSGGSMSMVVHSWVEIGSLPPFHGGNRGSNPLGDARLIKHLFVSALNGVPGVCRP
jgi:hypothetical protein